jgi:hypothetical protein
MKVRWVYLTSSDIERVMYLSKTKLLVIQFVSAGRIYVYGNVSIYRYRQLVSATSHGKYFHRFIRNKKEYPYQEIELDDAKRLGLVA